MPGVNENLSIWTGSWNWAEHGDEWSAWWGGTEAMWRGALVPRIHPFLPAGTILEIAPGFGRWTQFLKDECERLLLVDLAPNCIEHCKERFSAADNIEYHVNDGRSLEMVADGSVDFAFSFDSLVHADADVLESYLRQLARKLTPDGVGFFHHSNLGAYRRSVAIAHRVPRRYLKPLIERGAVVDLVSWRSESVSAESVAAVCERVGLACVSQEKINWVRGWFLIDALTVFTRPGSRWDRPRRVVRNPLFRQEANRTAALYARTSYRAGT